MDDTETECLIRLGKLIFHNTDYSRPTAGYITDIKKISRDNLFKYFKNYYVPSNMLLSINTNLSFNNVLDYLKNINFIMNDKVSVKSLYTPKLEYIKPKKQITIKKNKNLEQTYLSLGFHFPFGFLNRKNTYISRLLERYLGGTMSSVLYIALREQAGIGYSIWADTIIKPDQGCFIIYTSFVHKKLKKTMDIILDRLEILYKQGMNTKHLSREINAYKKSIELKLESPMYLADYYANVGLYGIKDTPFDYPSITIDDVNNFIKDYMNPKDILVSIITK
jgi:predicted Zn-dependent peptidase